MSEPPTFAEIKARLASLRAERDGAGGGVAPPSIPTPEQISAIRETMGILSEPEMLARVGRARRAVAAAEVVGLEDLGGDFSTAPGEWRVALAEPVVRELTETGGLSDTALRELLDTLRGDPSRGRALGFGLAGMRVLGNDSCRVLYAIDDEGREVTVVSVDQP